MKNVLFAPVGLCAMVWSAAAADMVPVAYAVPPPPVPVVWGWAGLYIGANLGWAGSSSNSLANAASDKGPRGLGTELGQGLIPSSVGVSHNGFIGGAQVGYNWQFTSLFLAGNLVALPTYAGEFFGPTWVAGIVFCAT
jgi:outer membrane immunogenic protein